MYLYTHVYLWCFHNTFSHNLVIDNFTSIVTIQLNSHAWSWKLTLVKECDVVAFKKNKYPRSIQSLQ